MINVEMLRLELNELLRPMRKENLHRASDNIVMFGVIDEETAVTYAFCYDEQVDMVLEFLQPRVDFVSIRELGGKVYPPERK